jgi:transcriptional regulator with XRE-family HTH domain
VTRFRVRDISELRRRVKTSRREVIVVPYSVRTLAERVGVNRSTIGYLISGKRPVVNEAVAKGVAEALEVSVEELFVPEDSQSREGECDAQECSP